MSNRFAPPDTSVRDILDEDPRASWPRICVATVGFSILALLLGWQVAPRIAFALAGRDAFMASGAPSAKALALDLALTFGACLLCCWLGAITTRGRAWIAPVGVAFACWFVYFVEVGGLPGMLHSEYPIWYEFCPSHIVAAAIAIFMTSTRRNRSTPVAAG